MITETYRHVLKQETHPDHDRVDQAMSEIVISERQGHTKFLAIHLACYEALVHCADASVQAQGYLMDMIGRLKSDLKSLNAAHSQQKAILPAGTMNADPLALDYVLEGSRLGAQVLKRRWAKSVDASVLSADAYFSMRPVGGRWREICEALATVEIQSARAAQITKDTRALFDLFHDTTVRYDGRVMSGLEVTS